MKFLLVLVAMTALDVVWAWYTINVAKGYPLRAAVWAVVLYVLGAYVTLAYVEDKRTLIAACVGSFIGTFVGVKFKSAEPPLK